MVVSILQTSSRLRHLAKKKPSEEQEIIKLGNYVESFACALVEPFEEDELLGSKLGDRAIEMIIDTSINCEQKKVLNDFYIW